MGKQWDKIFKYEGKIFNKVQENIPEIAKLFKKKGVKRVLDLGSGSGRHIIYLAKKGFDVYGIDNSVAGIKITKDWLRRGGLKANLKVGSVYKKLPYKDNFFDAIISVQVINHATIKNIRKSIKEIERILKPGGLIFITVRRRIFRKWRLNSIIIEPYKIWGGKYKIINGKCRIIGPRTYVPLDGGEKGLIHFLFSEKLFRREFRNFKVHHIGSTSNKRHYRFLGELK